MTVVNADAVPRFVNLLQSPSIIVAEQSVWALGNIAGDGPTTRDIVLKHNVIEGLLQLIEKQQPVSDFYIMHNMFITTTEEMSVSFEKMYIICLHSVRFCKISYG